MVPRLKELYLKEIQPALKTQFGLKNLFMGPKIEKVVINMGLGLDGNDSKILKSCEGSYISTKPIPDMKGATYVEDNISLLAKIHAQVPPRDFPNLSQGLAEPQEAIDWHQDQEVEI